MSPTITESGDPLFESWTAAAGVTVVWTLALLFELVGSAVVDDTVAVLVMPGTALAPAVATIVTVTSLAAPAFTVPMLQLTVPVPEQVPFVDVADTDVRPARSGSESVTPAAALGPLSWTVSVYVRLLPAVTGSGE